MLLLCIAEKPTDNLYLGEGNKVEVIDKQYGGCVCCLPSPLLCPSF